MKKTLSRLGRFIATSRKAILSGLGTGITAAIPLLQDGHLSVVDALIIVGAALGVGGITYGTPNAD